MRKFSITVNGQAFEVEVEEIGGAPVFAPASVAAPAPVAAAPAPAAAAAPAPAAAAPAAPKAAPAAAGGEPVKAPMPGTLLDVKVAVGQSVKTGDVLVILEAMKMENEIVAARDGVIAAIVAAKGSNVSAGDVLVTMN